MAKPADDATGAVAPGKPKKELTDEQKKQYKLFGVMGVLAVITAAIYVPGMFSKGPQLPQAETPATQNAADAETPVSNDSPDPAAPAKTQETAATPDAAAPAAAAGPAPVARFRPDPMQPFYTEAVSPDPTPTPIPPVVIPAPRPQIALPVFQGPGAPSMAVVGLPQPRIPNLNQVSSGPQVSSAPRRRVGDAGTASSEPVASYNKRLSGVMVGDGVRALLEINNGETIVTRVVQPGDEVDGISVLSIQRITEGNRTVTRMTIREDGEERFVDLKPAPQQPAGATPPA